MPQTPKVPQQIACQQNRGEILSIVLASTFLLTACSSPPKQPSLQSAITLPTPTDKVTDDLKDSAETIFRHLQAGHVAPADSMTPVGKQVYANLYRFRSLYINRSKAPELIERLDGKYGRHELRYQTLLPMGREEISVIFFEQNGKYLFHDVWISTRNGDDFGKYVSAIGTKLPTRFFHREIDELNSMVAAAGASFLDSREWVKNGGSMQTFIRAARNVGLESSPKILRFQSAQSQLIAFGARWPLYFDKLQAEDNWRVETKATGTSSVSYLKLIEAKFSAEAAAKYESERRREILESARKELNSQQATELQRLLDQAYTTYVEVLSAADNYYPVRR